MPRWVFPGIFQMRLRTVSKTHLPVAPPPHPMTPRRLIAVTPPARLYPFNQRKVTGKRRLGAWGPPPPSDAELPHGRSLPCCPPVKMV